MLNYDIHVAVYSIVYSVRFI